MQATHPTETVTHMEAKMSKHAYSAAGTWLRAFTLFLVLLVPGLARGQILDQHVAPNAAIQSFKFDFGYADDAAYIAARTASYRAKGLAVPNVADGELYYRTGDNLIRYYDGTVPYNAANWATYVAAGGGVTLDAAYTSGQTIARDLATFSVTDAMADAVSTLTLNRTAGTGAVIDLTNTGSGDDILGDLWNIDTSGRLSIQRVDLGDDDPVRFGSAMQMVTFEWDTDPATDEFSISNAMDAEIMIGEDAGAGAGGQFDVTFYAGTTLDLMRWDNSDQLLYFVDSHVKLGDNDIHYFGNGSGGAAAADGDYSVYSDATNLLFIPEAAGTNGIVFGAVGDGVDFTIYGNEAASSVVFNYGGGGTDTIDVTDYDILMGDDDMIEFGATPDAMLYWVDATGVLQFLDATSGSTPIHFGDSNDGMDVQFFVDDTGGGDGIIWDADVASLITTDALIQLTDTDQLQFGTGAGGDLSLSANANVLSLLQTVAGTGTFAVGVDDHGIDTTFFGETASDYMMWDQALGAMPNAALRFVAGPDIHGDADFAIRLGMGDTTLPAVDGFAITSTATAMSIDAIGVTAGDSVSIGANVDTDFNLYGTGAAIDVFWDWGAELLMVQGDANVRLIDERNLQFGTGPATNGDIFMAWTDMTATGPGTWTFQVAPTTANDVDMVFGDDNTANDVNVYFLSATNDDWIWWDSSNKALTSVDSLLRFGDGTATDDAIQLGATAGGDALVYWDTADDALVITPAATAEEINFGDEDVAVYPELLWHAGAATNVVWDPIIGAALGFVLYTGVDSMFDEDSTLMFDVAAPNIPADGFGINGNAGGATDYLDVGNYGGGGLMRVGYIGGAAADTDVSFYGNGGDIGMTWNYGDDRLTFAAGGGIWLPDTRTLNFGNVVANPDVTFSFESATGPTANALNIEALGGANTTITIGDDDANRQITTIFGEDDTAAVQINPNAAALHQIEYLTQQPIESIWLPADQFVPGAGAPAVVADNASYGYQMTEAGPTDSIQIVWNPMGWVNADSDIEAYIMFSCTAAGNTDWELHRVLVQPGVTNTNAADGAPDAQTAACAVANRFYDTSAVHFTIDAALVVNSSFQPIRLTLVRRADTDTNAGECNVYGMMLSVVRRYGD